MRAASALRAFAARPSIDGATAVPIYAQTQFSLSPAAPAPCHIEPLATI